ncbi:C40 family peptidase [Microlunatus phosphovorus]|nr:C40 family peptidase [Microlunatus phosphovorus]
MSVFEACPARAPLGRRVITSLAALSGAGVLIAICGVTPAHAASSTGVATTTVNIRTGASTSATVVGRLVRGQKITVNGHATGDWVKVRFRGTTAYMDGEYLDRVGARPAAPKRIPAGGTKIATEELNVRTGPSTRYRIASELAEGSAITLTGRFSGGYAQFRQGTATRWVSAAYLAEAVGSASPSRPVPVSISNPVSSSHRGQVALAFARAQLGEPYVFGATGPDRWDCSGLSQAAWRAAGVSIPRTTYTQFKVGKRVARADLQLGDLVFFYGSNPSHVGLYAGDGLIINAPRPGKTVSYSKISSMPYAGAVRPG